MILIDSIHSANDQVKFLYYYSRKWDHKFLKNFGERLQNAAYEGTVAVAGLHREFGKSYN